MSASTPRTISNAPELRQLLAAVGALILAVALLVAVTISRQTSAPAVGSQDLVVSTADGGLVYKGIPYPAVGSQDLVVGSGDGGLVYTGIPYPAPAFTGVPDVAAPYVSLPQADGLVVATQNGGILYTGIPYPAPEPDAHSHSKYIRIPQ